ncbi:serine/threonine-protein kinase atg1-like [Panonychus citri]|nr:serine/threonine-protein kinase atg1-like [Panonychus citri]XP_053203559.1 serine/threonine-protein kinase atg1-like [Panonychus citri]
MDNNVFETSIALPVSLPVINDQSLSLLNEEVTEDQLAAFLGDYFANNQETFSSDNTTTTTTSLVKQEKETNSNNLNFFDNSKSNEDKMDQQPEAIINSEQSHNQGLNNYPNQSPSNVFQSSEIRMATYTPSINRPSFQGPSPQSLSLVSSMNGNFVMPSSSVPQQSYMGGNISQSPGYQWDLGSSTRVPPVFSKSNSDNYFARLFDPFGNVLNQQNRQMGQNTNTNSNKSTGVKNGRIRRYFNDNHASHMRNTFNRINQQTSVDFDLMTKVFNDLKAPYELPFTKEQVIECYDWFVGAIQYNYVPGRRKQLPRETNQSALRDELRMIEAAKKAADPSKEVICLD